MDQKAGDAQVLEVTETEEPYLWDAIWAEVKTRFFKGVLPKDRLVTVALKWTYGVYQ